ncbi:MAG: hypothetical protein AAGA55_01925 [Planctomycetota bacterium]
MPCTPIQRSFLPLIAVILALTGCGSLEDTIAAATGIRDQAAQARVEVVTQLESMRASRESLEPGSPEHAEATAAITLANARMAALDAAILQADRVIAEITDPSDGLTQGVGTITPFLPAPAQGPALLGAALVATLLRAHQVRKGAGSIAASIRKAMDDPDFKQAFERQAGTIRSIQTPAARRIVDQETGSRPGLRLPI